MLRNNNVKYLTESNKREITYTSLSSMSPLTRVNVSLHHISRPYISIASNPENLDDPRDLLETPVPVAHSEKSYPAEERSARRHRERSPARAGSHPLYTEGERESTALSDSDSSIPRESISARGRQTRRTTRRRLYPSSPLHSHSPTPLRALPCSTINAIQRRKRVYITRLSRSIYILRYTYFIMRSWVDMCAARGVA